MYKRQFLDSLSGAISQPYEVILADNGSTDGTPQAAAAALSLIHI